MNSFATSDQNDKADHTFKILTIGESGVGKTCILLRYTDNKFSKHHLTTIGIDFKIKILTLLNRKIKLYIWDTAGQERFRNIAQQYYNGADGIFLVFDVTERTSFNKVTEWMKQILSYNTQEKTGIILLGNKVDADNRLITQEEGYNLANEFGIKYFETSALNNYNLDESFNCMVEEIINKKKIDIKNVKNVDTSRISITNKDHLNRTSHVKSFCKC
jgi:small GTP-binding protein